MEKALEMRIQGIKCDNPECDYKDKDVVIEDYGKWINKPCPKCGANLLTQQDHDTTIALMEICNSLNEILPKPIEDEEIAEMSIEMNGTGKVEFKRKYVKCGKCGKQKLFYNFHKEGYECENCNHEITRNDMDTSLKEAYENYVNNR